MAEFIDKLDVVGRFDRGIGAIKKRDRGASAGELSVAMAQSQLLGADALIGLDRQRTDVAAVELSAVPVLASTTAAGLARRFGPEHLVGVEAAVADLARGSVELLRSSVGSSSARVSRWTWTPPMWRSTAPRRTGVAYNYAGQRAGRPHLATWAVTTIQVITRTSSTEPNPRATP